MSSFFSPFSLVTVGSLAFDSIRSPSGFVEKALGGSINYFSLSASFFCHVRLVGVVGDDFPQSHLDYLKSKNIDISGVERRHGQTFHWSGEYNSDLNDAKTLSTCLNVFEGFQPILPASYRSSDYVFLANMDPDLQSSVLSQVEKPKMVAMDTMNFWIQSKKESLLKTISKVDLISINQGEAYQISGTRNLLDATSFLHRLGPKVVVIKQGEYGALLSTSSGFFSAPALPLSEVKDPTGAGDTFAGALMGYMASHGITGSELASAKGETLLRQAVILGSVLASFTVEDFGPKQLMKTNPEDIRKRYDQFLKMTKFDPLLT